VEIRIDDVRSQVETVLDAAGVPASEVVDFERLGGGTFNTVFRVRRTDGSVLVIKLAPGPDVTNMRHERGLLATEALFYERTQDVEVAVPTVLAHGAELEDAGEWLVMTECGGQNWSELTERIDERRRRTLRHELGRQVANVHTVTGPAFGYPSESVGPLRETWRSAFTDMLEAVLDDADRFNASLPWPTEHIRAAYAANSAVLDDVTVPSLVHFDLWDGNILIDGLDGSGAPRIGGLIDAERAFWGDPLAEFVSLALLGDIQRDDAFLDGYRAAGGSVTFDEPERRRLALYRTYLYLIMLVEAVPRAFDESHRAWRYEHVVPELEKAFDAWSRQGTKPLR
jgi:aminoglycoside phosphotransferase (APT) family kinase protein